MKKKIERERKKTLTFKRTNRSCNSIKYRQRTIEWIEKNIVPLKENRQEGASTVTEVINLEKQIKPNLQFVYQRNRETSYN